MGQWMDYLLFGLLFFLVFFVPLKALTSERRKILRDFEEAMEQFSFELGEDNKKIIETFAEMKKELEMKIAHLNAKMEMLEKWVQQKPEAGVLQKPDAAVLEEGRTLAVEGKGSKESSPDTGSSIKERYKDLFALYDKGKPIDYIAKHLGMNKGEVLTIIQLAKHES